MIPNIPHASGWKATDFALQGTDGKIYSLANVRGPKGTLVRCLSCRHRGVIAEADLARFGIKPGAPVAQFVRRLRCRQRGSGSVMAQRTTARSVA